MLGLMIMTLAVITQLKFVLGEILVTRHSSSMAKYLPFRLAVISSVYQTVKNV